MVPNALLAGEGWAMLPKGVPALLLLPNVKDDEKLVPPPLLLLPVFCDANGFGAEPGPALKLKPPLGSAGENPAKALVPDCCWEGGGKLWDVLDEPATRGRPLSGFSFLFANCAAVAFLGLSSPDTSPEPSPKKFPSLLNCWVAPRFDMVAVGGDARAATGQQSRMI